MNAPLTDRDYAGIRAAVMREIGSPLAARRSPGWVLAFAALAIVLIVLVVPQSEVLAPSSPIRRLRVIAVSPATGDRRPATETQPARGKRQAASHPRPKRKHIKKQEIQQATRMDIQTADPDIRIIWFARQEDSK